MTKIYNVPIDNDQMSLILKVINLRGNQLMSRHTRGADWELGQLDSLQDHLTDVIIAQSDFNKLNQIDCSKCVAKAGDEDSFSNLGV